jgi:hypothetical protein
VRAWIFSTICDAVKREEVRSTLLCGAESKVKYEREINRYGTCRVEVFLMLFWLKRRSELDGFGAASAFGVDGLVVGITMA